MAAAQLDLLRDAPRREIVGVGRVPALEIAVASRVVTP